MTYTKSFLRSIMAVAIALPVAMSANLSSAQAGHKNFKRGAIIAGAIIGGAILYKHHKRKKYHRSHRRSYYGRSYYHPGHRYNRYGYRHGHRHHGYRHHHRHNGHYSYRQRWGGR